MKPPPGKNMRKPPTPIIARTFIIRDLTKGVYYMNVASLGKSVPGQYAVDLSLDKGRWLPTSPLNQAEPLAPAYRYLETGYDVLVVIGRFGHLPRIMKSWGAKFLLYDDLGEVSSTRRRSISDLLPKDERVGGLT